MEVFVDTNDTVFALDLLGNPIVVWTKGNSTPSRIISNDLSSPYSLFVTTLGDIYVDSSMRFGHINKWTSSSTMYTCASIITKTLQSNGNALTIVAGTGTAGNNSYELQSSQEVILPHRSSVKSFPNTKHSSISSIDIQDYPQELKSRKRSSEIRRSTNTEEHSSDDDDDDEELSTQQNRRFSSQINRTRRRSSIQSLILQPRSLSLHRSNIHIIPMKSKCITVDPKSYKDLRGQTLIHLAARLGYDAILRLLVNETSQTATLVNKRGQTPLLTAIEAGSTHTAILLMECDPRSLIVMDDHRSNVFHYACEYSNDVVLNRAIALLNRFNSSTDRLTGLKRLTERNHSGKTAFDIAIWKGQLKCMKQFLTSSWLNNHIDIGELINADSLKNVIDQNQFDILSFLINDMKRLAYIIRLLIDIDGQYFNLLEYAIFLKKNDIIRLLVSVHIPTEHYISRQEYKLFLRNYNLPFIQSGSSSFYQTPIQRMLTTPECILLVPLLLEQFVDDNGIDLSVIDDCLYNRPKKSRCIFGRGKNFSTRDWLQQHPLALIAKANCKAIYDHQFVRMCVDLKFNLFGNFLYFFILGCQLFYVTLYTGVTLGSPTPANQGTNYYQTMNYSCHDLCIKLVNDSNNPAQNQPGMHTLRLILLIISCLGLIKEFYQMFTQREKYFHRFYINLIELHIYVSAIIYSADIDECTRQTGIRCSTQWMTGGIGLLSVWTSLLLVVMNGIKFGKYGLLFITVFTTFLKFIAVYIFIWIGYILAFYMICKDIMEQFLPFNFIPKLLVMFIGEYDMDSIFFSNNNQLMPGAEGALILYSAFIFTMFIVMSNIMGGLAVADVKEFRLNAKREHLRSRIDVILGFQAYLGGFCETIGSITMKLCKNRKWHDFLKRIYLIRPKYHLEKLHVTSDLVNIPHRISTLSLMIPTDHFSAISRPRIFEQVHPQMAFYIHCQAARNTCLSHTDETMILSKTNDEIRDTLEESVIRTNNELRKIALNLQNELEDIKRRITS
ncbi:hypothetical protein I4U23_023217 [Adineta vaga]|nr:hypothetical protein I4U23_023217 [Adineta vaga]